MRLRSRLGLASAEAALGLLIVATSARAERSIEAAPAAGPARYSAVT
jgi:hypothetical protein